MRVTWSARQRATGEFRGALRSGSGRWVTTVGMLANVFKTNVVSEPPLSTRTVISPGMGPNSQARGHKAFAVEKQISASARY